MMVHRITLVDGGTAQHLDAAYGSDFTLCGLTLDGDPLIVSSQRVVFGRVTCDRCLAIVDYCTEVKKTIAWERKSATVRCSVCGFPERSGIHLPALTGPRKGTPYGHAFTVEKE